LEQAKKRDHKILITNIAISKVPYIKVLGLSEDVCKAIQIEHKEILKISQTDNDSNEVLSLMLKDLSANVRVMGSEFEVRPADNPEAVSLFNKAQRYEMMYLHNHPSTNKFSLADLMTFIKYGNIGVMSVVTNQGNAYILSKTVEYDYRLANKIFDEIYLRYRDEKIDHNVAVYEFLKVCHRGGIIYAKSDKTAGYKR